MLSLRIKQPGKHRRSLPQHLMWLPLRPLALALAAKADAIPTGDAAGR
jgi:hypothetical protein